MTEEQAQMFKLLQIFKRLCEENELQYYIMGGTLLGAVRHKGFIPWDDDADVSMPLRDFLKFQKLADKLPNDIVIQSEENDLLYPFVFIKLCDTTCRFETGFINHPQGVYIDIFPLIPAKRLNKSTRFCFDVINVINYVLQVKLNWSSFLPYKNCMARIGYSLLKNFSVKHLRRLRRKLISAIYDENSRDTFCSPGGAYKADKEFYPAEWFEEVTDVIFEDERFSAPKKWHKYLSRNYGNYMELPAPEERHTEHKKSK